MIANTPIDTHLSSPQLVNNERMLWIINGKNSATIQIITIDTIKFSLVDFDFIVLRMATSTIYENKIAIIEL